MSKEVLSHREFELLEPLVFGKTKKEVAAKHNLSIYTVETTVKNAYKKVMASNLAEFIMWYYSVTFDMAKEITEKKKEVLSVVLLLVCLNVSNGLDMIRNNTRTMQAQSSTISCSRLRSRRRERRRSLEGPGVNQQIFVWTA